MKKENKKVKNPIIKTKVKPDNSVEVELRDPSKTVLGKIFIIILVAGMTILSLVSLIYLLIQVSK